MSSRNVKKTQITGGAALRRLMQQGGQVQAVQKAQTVQKLQVIQKAQKKELQTGECEGNCDKHIKQLTAYLKYLKHTLSQEVLKKDKIDDTKQTVFYCNTFLLNLCCYFFDHYGENKALNMAAIQKAFAIGNEENKKNDDKIAKFRTRFWMWTGSEEYADLLTNIDLGCVVNTTTDLNNDYLIKIACISYGLQLLFAESDLQEVINYMDASWFSGFIRGLNSKVSNVSNECSVKVGVARKGLRLLGKIALATGRGAIYAVPKIGKAAMYTGTAAWYTGEAAVRLAAKVPGVKTAAELTGEILLTIGERNQNRGFMMDMVDIFG
jgi:hypothetical protein